MIKKRIFHEKKCAAGKTYQTQCAAGKNLFFGLFFILGLSPDG
jgi:hypothetical protein